LQSPNGHFNGDGCPKCANNVKFTKEKFVKLSIEKHGYKYDYSKVIYKNNRTPVIIICKEHSDFEQNASNHINGSNCPTCVYETREFGSYKAGNVDNWGHLDGYFYIVELINIDTKEIFKKFGISKEPAKRFKAYGNYKLNKVITCESMLLKDAYNKETSMKKEIVQYIPQQKFWGYTECFISYKEYNNLSV